MRIFMLTDLEGVAGVVSFEPQTFPTGKYYDNACRLLTAEVNAEVEGLLASGATEILVADGHGPGAIWFEDLHPKAKLLHGRPITWKQFIGAVQGFDAAVIVGQHAMAGTQTGNLNHTQSSASIDFFKLNGRPIGEIAQFALYAGACKIPVIHLTGDEDACREARELIPGIATTAVKQGMGRGVAISISASESRRLIRAGAEAALRNHQKNPVAPLVWPGPYVLEKRFFQTDAADLAALAQGVERVDSQTIRLRGDDIQSLIYR